MKALAGTRLGRVLNVSPRASGRHWVTIMNYRNRTVCFAIGYAGFAAQLIAVGAPYPVLAWTFITGYYLLFPNVHFALARRSASPTEHELRNLMLDSAAFGVSCALVGLPLWPTAVLAFCAAINHVAFHGPSGVIKGPIPMLITGTVTSLLLGLDGMATASLWSNVFFSVALFLLFFAIAVGAQQRNRSLRETRNELHSSRAALETANEKLKHQMEANNRFFAYAGHDLRQPLQAMQMFSTVLLRTDLPPPSRNAAVQLDKSIRSLAGLLDCLLDISRLESGTIHPQRVALDLHLLLQDLVDELEPMARAKRIQLRLWTPADELTALTDPALLETVVRNLAVNAIKYTPPGGRVLLAARRRAGQAQIGVLDNGQGIPDDQLPRIFDDFFQADNSERNSSKGLGLGLAIVRRISTLLGLDVTCRSRLGKGSSFWMHVPVATLDTPTSTLTPQQDTHALLQGQEVVILEDTDEVALALKAWLTAHGAQVQRYRTPAEALQGRPLSANALYLCDQRLPGALSGMDFLNRISRDFGRRAYGFLLTGETSESFILEAEQHGWPVVFKPFTPERLTAELNTLLSSKTS